MKRAWLLAISAALVGGLASCHGDAGTGPSDDTFQPLEFPFVDPGVIVRMAAWGIPNWSGSEQRTIEAIARYPSSTVPGGRICVGLAS